MKTYDVVVIGTGGVGSAAVFHLAQRGVRVLGLDRFSGAHDRGSSHGQTRMIRQAYCEHPDYVPLVQRAFELWGELEQRTSQRFYYETGVLEVGPPGGLVVPGVLQSARQHGLKVDTLDDYQMAQRFPGFPRMPEGATAVFEQRGGFLLAEPCVLAHQIEAIKLGAELRSGQAVRNWNIGRNGVVVRTDQDSFTAGRLIVAAGAWASQLLADLGVPLAVVRKPQNWFATSDVRYRADQSCPTFLFEVPEGTFYGFPAIDARGVKIGEHTGGIEITDPTNVDRGVDPLQREQVRQFLRTYLPGVTGPATDHSVCMYTNSPDGHFIVDRHPAHEEIAFAAGLSGHGFKFIPVLGEALADLAIEGGTRLSIEFLNLGRFP